MICYPGEVVADLCEDGERVSTTASPRAPRPVPPADQTHCRPLAISLHHQGTAGVPLAGSLPLDDVSSADLSGGQGEDVVETKGVVEHVPHTLLVLHYRDSDLPQHIGPVTALCRLPPSCHQSALSNLLLLLNKINTFLSSPQHRPC